MCMLYLQREEVIQGRNHDRKNSEEGGSGDEEGGLHNTAKGSSKLRFMSRVLTDDLSSGCLKAKQSTPLRDTGGSYPSKSNPNLIVLHTRRGLGCAQLGWMKCLESCFIFSRCFCPRADVSPSRLGRELCPPEGITQHPAAKPLLQGTVSTLHCFQHRETTPKKGVASPGSSAEPARRATQLGASRMWHLPMKSLMHEGKAESLFKASSPFMRCEQRAAPHQPPVVKGIEESVLSVTPRTCILKAERKHAAQEDKDAP